MSNITVRDVDDKVFREFKAAAAKQGLTIGQALTFAMLKYKSELKPKKKLTDYKSSSWGPETMYVSEQIDDIMYGEK